ncbi:MAG: TolC family protein, partial [Bacteroidales bacterium]|nr:TolC family protein [Bacteroidales bacterium]
ITLKVLTYNTQKKQLSIAQRACDISDKRLEAEKTRYILGSGDFTRLHDAITDKDNSLYTYLESLKTYWELHHEIRQLTLYDFEKNKAIDTDFRELIRQK